MYKPSTLECFKQKRSMSRYDECIEDTFIDPDEDKVYTRILWCGQPKNSLKSILASAN